MNKKVGRPKGDPNDVKNDRAEVKFSSNDCKAHGSREKLIEALYVARNEPYEMHRLIKQIQDNNLTRCENEALKSNKNK